MGNLQNIISPPGFTTASAAQPSQEQHHSTIQQWINKIFSNALYSVSTTMKKNMFLNHIHTKLKDATTILLSQKTWFNEFLKYVHQDIICVCVRVPLTIRLNNEYTYKCILLDAYVDYEIRIIPKTIQKKSKSNIISYQRVQESNVEQFIASHAMEKMDVIVSCKMSSSVIQHASLSNILGVPLSATIASQVANTIFSSEKWNKESLHDWFSDIYSTGLSKQYYDENTPDRMLCALRPNDDEDSSDEDISATDQIQEPTTNVDDTTSIPQPKTSPKHSVVKHSVVIVGTYGSSQQEKIQSFQDELKNMVEPYQTICYFDMNVFYILTNNSYNLVINEKIHNIYKTHEHEITEFQIMMMNIQHTEKIGTHITHIEVIV